MEKKKKTAIIVGCIVFILVAVIITLVFLLLRKETPEDGSGEAKTYVIEEGNYQEIMDEMDSQVEAGYFETYMNTEWTFSDGTSETQDAILGNSPNNTSPIRCEVLLGDTDEVIYSTGVLPVGAQVAPFKLEKDLEAGVYDALCMVYLMKEENGTYTDVSSAGFRVTITVEN